ncbi:hypothetical protein FKM82_005457 [Ascaphus truei]
MCPVCIEPSLISTFPSLQGTFRTLPCLRQTMSESPRPGLSPAHQTESPLPKTSDFYRVREDLPGKFNHPDTWSRGYSAKVTHPLYRTTNQTYGSKPPTVHEMPTSFNGTSHRFSKTATRCGMYRNNGFNTDTEKSYVTGPDNFITLHDRLNFHKSYNLMGPSQ